VHYIFNGWQDCTRSHVSQRNGRRWALTNRWTSFEPRVILPPYDFDVCSSNRGEDSDRRNHRLLESLLWNQGSPKEDTDNTDGFIYSQSPAVQFSSLVPSIPRRDTAQLSISGLVLASINISNCSKLAGWALAWSLQSELHGNAALTPFRTSLGNCSHSILSQPKVYWLECSIWLWN
jgi:hypothetical protein